MNGYNINKKIKTIFWQIVSCFMCSIAVNWVALPNGFVVTGYAGLAMTAEKFFGIHYALVYYLISFVVLIAAYFVLGLEEIKNILFLSALYPACLWILNHFTVSIIFKEKLIAAALFGVLYGVGAGIVLKVGCSYGGMDTVAKILKKTIFQDMELKTVMLMADSMIMLVMLTAFSLDQVAYAFVGQLVAVNSLNYVIFNMGPKLYEVQIISDWSEDIEHFMIDQIHKSLTLHKVQGGFSGEQKVQMDCVCTSKDYVHLREFILEHDHDCFIKVSPLTYVFGTNKDFRNLKDIDI